MIRRPPRSTLFPTRRSSDLAVAPRVRAPSRLQRRDGGPARRIRSEEHTTELQSQSNLVCRLLLENKNMLVNSAKVMNYRSLSLPTINRSNTSGLAVRSPPYE